MFSPDTTVGLVMLLAFSLLILAHLVKRPRT